MITAIIGSRHYDPNRVTLQFLAAHLPADTTEIVSGGQAGPRARHPFAGIHAGLWAFRQPCAVGPQFFHHRTCRFRIGFLGLPLSGNPHGDPGMPAQEQAAAHHQNLTEGRHYPAKTQRTPAFWFAFWTNLLYDDCIEKSRNRRKTCFRFGR